MALLSYEEALSLVRQEVEPIARRIYRLPEKALGRTIMNDVFATSDHPSFESSSVDGYAVDRSWEAGCRLKVHSEPALPGKRPPRIPEASAVRILTGAPTPANTYAIVMQEETSVEAGFVLLESSPAKGDWIRRKGEDIRAGEPLLGRGFRINPAAIGLLTSQGIRRIQLTPAARVSILTTGDELVDLDDQPDEGQVRDSNAPMLEALIDSFGRIANQLRRVHDDRSSLRSAILEAAQSSDLVIVSGGASVGDRDYVASVVDEIGRTIFHGVAIRPGKPVLFGRIGKVPLIGLPGNPASSFVCSHLFVRPALERLEAVETSRSEWIVAQSGFANEPPDREEFVRVILTPSKSVLQADRLPMQLSFGLKAAALAHGLMRVPKDLEVRAGDFVSVLPV
jgi:molybdopterin molybdotransferase